MSNDLFVKREMGHTFVNGVVWLARSPASSFPNHQPIPPALSAALFLNWHLWPPPPNRGAPGTETDGQLPMGMEWMAGKNRGPSPIF